MNEKEIGNPYPGLRPFKEDESHLFFGRDGQSEAILSLLQRQRFTAVVGVSGCGKSSLVKAGLFPVLHGGLFPSGHSEWKIASIRPGSSPIRNLAHKLVCAGVSVDSEDPGVFDADSVVEASLRRSTCGIADLMEQVALAQVDGTIDFDLLIVVDQFEELFRYDNQIPAEEREHFVRLLIESVRQHEWPVHVVITMRSDFLGNCAQFRDLPELINRAEYLVPRMTREERREAIEGPASVEGVEVTPRLLNRLLDDMGDDPDQLPVLQHALRRAWEHRASQGGSGRPLDLPDYEAVGTMSGALSRQAGAAYEGLGTERGKNIAEALFRTITLKGNDNRGVRRPTQLVTIIGIAEASLPEAIEVIDVFRDPELSFLIPPAGEKLDAESVIDISHESLMRNWETLRDWVDAEGKDADDYRRLVNTAERWKAGDADPLGDLEMERARLMMEAKSRNPGWSALHATAAQVELTHRFWNASEEAAAKRVSEAEAAARQAALEIERRRLQRLRTMMRAIWGVIALSIAIATIAMTLLFSQRRMDIARKQAEGAKTIATARALALNGIQSLNQDPELALLLSIESAVLTLPGYMETGSAPTAEIEMALRAATRESLIRRRYEGHTSKIYTIDFDREGQRLVTGAWRPDSTARIWDADGGQEIARLDLSQLPGGKTTISCARFSPDGRRIVTTTYREDGSVYVWDADPLRERGSDGPRIVTQPLLTFTGHNARISTAAFRPDGKIVATGGDDNMIRLWDPTTGMELCAPLGSGPIHHSKRIRSVAFNADGSQLLSTSEDGEAILWDTRPVLQASAGQPSAAAPMALRSFVAGTQEILHDGEFSPSGKWIATVGNDRYLRIWNAATGDQVAARGHPDSVMNVAFIDDDHLVTVCNDSALRFWTLGNAADESIGSFHPQAKSVNVLRLLATQKGHQGWIQEVAVSPDRRFVATAGDDATARLWKTPPGGEMSVMGGPDFESWAADIHFARETPTEPNRLFAYAGTAGGEIRAIDAFTERALVAWGPLAGDRIRHNREIRSICVSPDGMSLVTASSDQTAIVWDAITGKPKFQLSGHKGPAGGTVFQARFSADGKHIVTASNEGSARMWNAKTGAAERLLAPDRREFRGGDFANFAGLLGKLRQPEDPASAYLTARFTTDERAQLMDSSADTGTIQKTVTDMFNRLIREASLKDESAFRGIVKRPMTLDLAKGNPGENDRPVLNRLILEDTFPDELTRNCVYDARFSRDGSKIVTADFESRTATVWDARTGIRLMTFPTSEDPKKGHSDTVTSASFNPNGMEVVTACRDGYCRIWDVTSGVIQRIIPHGIAMRSAEYNPEGTLLLTAAADGLARLWTLPECQLRTELRGHTETLTDARFSNDGAYVVTASRDGTAMIYNTRLWGVYGLATQRATRKLTLAERQQYGVTRELTEEERAYYQKEDASR